ncbi:MAG: hypothetical protein H6Q41_407 [Deltaproteobacteria bacterium]|nr:hypothetical protein [Deltaproteobacteria bacterium]
MVIREDDFANNLHPAFPQQGREGVRVGDPGKSENLLSLRKIKLFFSMRTHETHRLVVAVKHLCLGVDFADLFFQRSRGLKIVHLGEKKKMGSAKMG